MRWCIGMAVALALVSGAARADIGEDLPTSRETVKPRSASDAVGEIRCTYYSDLMVRETGTDTPGPGQPRIIPITGSGHPACATATGILVKSEGFGFSARKGPFLLFSATDPNGAVPFFILTTAGKEIYRDSMIDSLHTMALEDGQLRITLLRGLNASCSVLKDGQACWAKIARDQHLPPAVSKLPPPTQACSKEYAKGKVEADDPSIITYEVDMKMDAMGRTQVISRGTLGCAPMP